MRTHLLSGALALSVLLVPASASAEVAVGEVAPDFDAEHYINAEPMKLSDLKGRVVFLELFSTT